MISTATKISICSNACLLLGANTISSFTDKTTEALVAYNLYESSYQNLLTTGNWNCATKELLLGRLAKGKYVHQLPSDLIYLSKVIETKEFEIQGDKLYSNQEVIHIKYIYRVDESQLPSPIVKALEFYMASQFAIPITGDLNKAKAMEMAYTKQLRLAKYIDSSQQPVKKIDSVFVDVRD